MAQVNSFALLFDAVYPPTNTVSQGVTYGDPANPLTGTNTGGGGGVIPVYPDEADVRLSVQYGDTGVLQYTGTAAIPVPADVRETVPVDASTGTIHIPPIAKVEIGYTYDAPTQELTGQLDCGFTGDSPEWVG